MYEYQDGDWYVFEEKARIPFERFKLDASNGLMQGFTGFFTTQKWKGDTCYVSSLGTRAQVSFKDGVITCKVRFDMPPAVFFKEKILSDVRSLTMNVSRTIAPENRDVFIVHGHDDEVKMELKDFLAGLGLKPVILNEQDDRGMTIIEKFEYLASTCSFAFILMTPDDRTADPNKLETRWRARQNVIMELGWFIARLGRERVIILHKNPRKDENDGGKWQGDIEIPSDISGVISLVFDKSVYEVSERIRQRLSGVGMIGG